MKKLFKLFLGVMATLVLIGVIATALSDTDPGKTVTTEGKAVTKVEKADSKPGKVEFEQVKSGMTLAEVEKILGPGKMDAESESNGIKVQMYSWQAEGDLGANISVTFMNGKADTKAQYGMK